MYRYFLTKRPPMTGVVPVPKGSKVVGQHDYGGPVLVPTLNPMGLGFYEYKVPVFGYVEYSEPLTFKQMEDHSLIECGPYYMNRQTGEILSEQMMLKQFEEEYDGNDPLNPLSYKEYYKEV